MQFMLIEIARYIKKEEKFEVCFGLHNLLIVQPWANHFSDPQIPHLSNEKHEYNTFLHGAIIEAIYVKQGKALGQTVKHCVNVSHHVL